MKRTATVKIATAVAVALTVAMVAAPVQAQQGAEKPNILFIVSDDTGYGDRR